MNEKIEQLVRRLMEKTEARAFKWAETPRVGAFRISLPTGLVRIESFSGYNDETYYELNITSREGKVLDSVRIDESDMTMAGFYPIGEVFKRLFVAARASALGLDDILDGMLRDVDAGKTVPEPVEDKVPGEDDIPF